MFVFPFLNKALMLEYHSKSCLRLRELSVMIDVNGKIPRCHLLIS